MVIKVTDIFWDTDDETVDLPSSVEITDSIDLDSDAIADYLSDKYGFLVEGFNYEAIDSFYQLLAFDTDTDNFFSLHSRSKDKVLSDGFTLWQELVSDYESVIEEDSFLEYQKMTFEEFSEEIQDGGLYIQCHFSRISFDFSRIELPLAI